MRSLGFSVAALALMAASGTALAAPQSNNVGSTVTTATSAIPLPTVQSSAGVPIWYGALNAPGGVAAYRTPFRGFVLPPYWMQPNFFIEDYARYGFAAPQDGFGWSRYYDDAVLTDSTGRVVDVVKDVDWRKFDQGQFAAAPGASFDEAGLDRRRPDARDFDRDDDRKHGRVGSAIGSVGGALIGGAVGAVAGNLIAGKGERLAGSLIGGGVGALAGLAVSEARGGKKHKHHAGHRGCGAHWGDSYPGGYYYETYQTVSYVPVEPIKTTTTTTKVVYETVAVAPHAKRPLKRRPHRCACHHR